MATTDCFALLDLPVQAALDEATLQSRYFEKSKTSHPDFTAGDSSEATQLNAAFETLRAPERRLKHLLELRTENAWRAIPMDSALMSLFEKLGPQLQKAGQFQKRRAGATTALAKALLAPEEMTLRESLEALGVQLEEQREQLEDTLPAIDQRINANDTTVWLQVQAIQAKLSYLARWQSQIREALLALM